MADFRRNDLPIQMLTNMLHVILNASITNTAW